MKENLHGLKKVTPRYVTGRMSLRDVPSVQAYKNCLDRAGFDEHDSQELTDTLCKLSEICIDVSDLRKVLIKDPQSLELDNNLTRALLILFLDVRTGNEYKSRK